MTGMQVTIQAAAMMITTKSAGVLVGGTNPYFSLIASSYASSARDSNNKVTRRAHQRLSCTRMFLLSALTSVHDRLKAWLIALGKTNDYEAWTPDRKNRVEVAKVRNVKVDYRPDVVWRKKGTNQKVFFELIFTEDFRKVVGEMFLASQVEGFNKMYFVRPTGDEGFWKNIEKLLRLAFRSEEGIVSTRYRPRFIIFNRSLERDSKFDEIKKNVSQALIEDKWIKRIGQRVRGIS